MKGDTLNETKMGNIVEIRYIKESNIFNDSWNSFEYENAV